MMRRDDAGMKNATTLIFPVGDFTSAIMRKVAESIGEASARGGTIVISLQWTARWSWDALCQLAESLHGRYRDARVCFTGVPPARLALLREVGLSGEWIVDEPLPGSAQEVLIAA
jgi:hypothetical protein